MDKDYIKQQIQEITTQEQIAFANWQRLQGARAFAQGVLAELEKDDPKPEDAAQLSDKDVH